MELARALQIMRRLESESLAVQERMKSLENYLSSQDSSASRMAVLEASVRDLESRLLNCESIMPKLTSLEVRIARLAALHEQMTNLESRLNDVEKESMTWESFGAKELTDARKSIAELDLKLEKTNDVVLTFLLDALNHGTATKNVEQKLADLQHEIDALRERLSAKDDCSRRLEALDRETKASHLDLQTKVQAAISIQELAQKHTEAQLVKISSQIEPISSGISNIDSFASRLEALEALMQTENNDSDDTSVPEQDEVSSCESRQEEAPDDGGDLASELTEDEEDVETGSRESKINNSQYHLKEAFSQSIYAYGYETPSPSYLGVISHFAAGKDMVVQASPGLDRMVLLVSSILEKVDLDDRTSQAIVIAPTTDVSLQIDKVTRQLGSYMKVRSYCCEGDMGDLSSDAIRNVFQNNHILIGYSRQIHELLTRGKNWRSHIKLWVLDEANELAYREPVFLERFMDFSSLSYSCQVAMFCSTVSAEVRTWIKKWMSLPDRMLPFKEPCSEASRHRFIKTEEEVMSKIYGASLCIDVFRALCPGQCIIFCNTDRKVSELRKEIFEQDHEGILLHSSMNCSELARNMRNFRRGLDSLLITTDLLSTPADALQTGCIINYGMPKSLAAYIYRASHAVELNGCSPTVVSFVTEKDMGFLKEIEAHYNTKILEF